MVCCFSGHCIFLLFPFSCIFHSFCATCSFHFFSKCKIFTAHRIGSLWKTTGRFSPLCRLVIAFWWPLPPLLLSRAFGSALLALCWCHSAARRILFSSLSIKSPTRAEPTAWGKLLMECDPSACWLSFALYCSCTIALWPAALRAIVVHGPSRGCLSAATLCAISFLRFSRTLSATRDQRTASLL